MNKYYQILDKVLTHGKTQSGRKGESRYLLNETVTLTPADLLDFEQKDKLRGCRWDWLTVV